MMGRQTVNRATGGARWRGGATVATLILRRCDALLSLTVADDWRGQKQEPRSAEIGGLGLLGRRERLAPWGGTVALAAWAGGGATLAVAMKALP